MSIKTPLIKLYFIFLRNAVHIKFA